MKWYYLGLVTWKKKGYVALIINTRFYSSWLPFPFAYCLEDFLIHVKGTFIASLLQGLISGIPLCCITYYLKTKRYKLPSDDFLVPEAEYIVCPNCARKGGWKKNMPMKYFVVKIKTPKPWLVEIRLK